jgi:hypothetical protein
MREKGVLLDDSETLIDQVLEIAKEMISQGFRPVLIAGLDSTDATSVYCKTGIGMGDFLRFLADRYQDDDDPPRFKH